MLLDADDSQLVLVDYQVRLMPAIFEGDLVVANAIKLARMARLLDVPVWGTAQSPDKLGPNVPGVHEAIDTAGGRILDKMHFSAVADGLGDWLRPPVRKAPASAPRGGNARSLPSICRNRLPRRRIRPRHHRHRRL